MHSSVLPAQVDRASQPARRSLVSRTISPSLTRVLSVSRLARIVPSSSLTWIRGSSLEEKLGSYSSRIVRWIGSEDRIHQLLIQHRDRPILSQLACSNSLALHCEKFVQLATGTAHEQSKLTPSPHAFSDAFVLLRPFLRQQRHTFKLLPRAHLRDVKEQSQCKA